MAAPDFVNITNAVDFATAAGAILALGAVLIVPTVVLWGVRKVMSMMGHDYDEWRESREDQDDGERFTLMGHGEAYGYHYAYTAESSAGLGAMAEPQGESSSGLGPMAEPQGYQDGDFENHGLDDHHR